MNFKEKWNCMPNYTVLKAILETKTPMMDNMLLKEDNIIIVSNNIPDKNLFILKNIYPNAKIIKETEDKIDKGEKE